eukprot:TRINITY_DN1310_c0_g2_i1.p1 TRINITY_DN1310_c0_g2~~TRINITY_DN1310_c0_g2_i1.p1  ORF type:complete len:293 (-),score=63.89 TRINITY_DN1310_c0_g2_i1:144-1022(-)
MLPRSVLRACTLNAPRVSPAAICTVSVGPRHLAKPQPYSSSFGSRAYCSLGSSRKQFHSSATCEKADTKESSEFSLVHSKNEMYNALLTNNKDWVRTKLSSDPSYFKNLAKGQQPNFLLIGCSDSRVPPDQLTKTQPGEMFIHRNVANLVLPSDTNCMSVLQYAVEVLGVKHVIVMGHYGCGGVAAAMSRTSFGLIDKWLSNIKDIYRLYKNEVDALPRDQQVARMVELNVQEQCINLHKTNIMQQAWKKGREVSIHGWVCNIETGLIHDLEVDKLPVMKSVQTIYTLDMPD